MKIVFHGVRGSIPSPGAETIRYGGNTVCVQVTLADGTILIFDAGSGMRRCGKALAEYEFNQPVNILHSHAHWDHLIGIPFFGPLYRRDGWVRTWPMASPAQRERQRMRVMFDGLHFPVRAGDLPARFENVLDESPVWTIGSAQVRRIALNHPGAAQGFRVDDADGGSFAYLTDNELTPPGPPETSLDELARFAAGVDVMCHDSQYLASEMLVKRGWGHSTVEDVLQLAKRAETKHLVLFHHDPERTDDELDSISTRVHNWVWEHAPDTHATVAHEGLVVSV